MGKLKLKLLTIALFGFTLLIVSPFVYARAAAVSTSDTFNFLSPSTVIDNTTNMQFVDGKPTDSTHSYFYTPENALTCNMPTSGGVSTLPYDNSQVPLNDNYVGEVLIDFFNTFPGGTYSSSEAAKTVKANLFYMTAASDGSCQLSSPSKITVGSIFNITAGFNWINGNQIQAFGNQYVDLQTISGQTTFNEPGTGDSIYSAYSAYSQGSSDSIITPALKAINNIPYSADSGGCSSFIAVNLASGVNSQLTNPPNNMPPYPLPATGHFYQMSKNPLESNVCQPGYYTATTTSGRGSVVSSRWTPDLPGGTLVYIGSSQLFKLSDALNPQNPVPSDSGSSSSTSDQCMSVNPLSWVICPVIAGASDLVNWGENVVQQELNINTSAYNQTGNSLYTAWSAIRIIATILLVAIALFVVISQILGFEFFSAYTVKKIIPRLVVSIILMQLSWILIVASIDIIDIIGSGVRDLLYAPFGIQQSIKATNFLGNIMKTPQGTLAATGTAFLGVVASASFFGGSIFIFLAVALGAAIAMLIALCVIILRQVIVMALLIVSPLAILAWILPNTQDLWKKWWSNLTKLLFMYPLIMGLLSIGVVFADITSKAASGPNATIDPSLAFLVIIVAYFGPFFLIPSTFKMSGSLMASVSSTAGNWSKKLKATDIAGLRARGKADKEYINKAKTTQAYKNLGNKDLGFINRTRAQWRTGTLNSGYTMNGRKILSERLGSATQAGLAAASQEEIDNANTTYSNATENEAFKDKINETEAIAMADIGKEQTLNGHKVQVTAAMKQRAFTELANTNQSDAVRRVVQYHKGKGDITTVNRMINSNVASLIKSTPDIVKGGSAAFQDLSTGDAAKLDETSWRNMSARVKYLTTTDPKANAKEIEKLQAIAQRAGEENSIFAVDMTQAKYQYANEIKRGGEFHEVDFGGRSKDDPNYVQENVAGSHDNEFIP